LQPHDETSTTLSISEMKVCPNTILGNQDTAVEGSWQVLEVATLRAGAVEYEARPQNNVVARGRGVVHYLDFFGQDMGGNGLLFQLLPVLPRDL